MSNAKNRVFASLLHCFKVGVKVIGPRSKVKVKLLACSGRYLGLGLAECSEEQQPPIPV